MSGAVLTGINLDRSSRS
ncbi:hypothetical protein [Nostoc sp. 'Peltigera membranacea cyanobiont' 232]|nr:hypothetical protein [Nostoc sp. 'Peltigera membranacea cyanobiont' 232]